MSNLPVDRVRDFLLARALVSDLDPEAIDAVSIAEERYELTVFDLWELIGAAVRHQAGGAA